MGASFLLGWMQAASGCEWSWEVYPAAVSVGLIAGALTVGGAVLAACPGQRHAAWLAALAAAVALDGFAIGPVQFGFFPQTFGLAFGSGVLVLRGLEIVHGRREQRSLPARLRAGLPLALLGAASVFCYSEFAPFLAVAWGGSYLLAPVPPRRVAGVAGAAGAGVAGGAADGPAHQCRVVRVWVALSEQAGVVVGSPIAWPPGKFLAHALGLHSAKVTGPDWWWQVQPWRVALALPAVAAFLLLVVRGARLRGAGSGRTRLGALGPSGILCGVCLLAFLLFRYFVANPWPEGHDGWRRASARAGASSSSATG